VDSVLTVGRYGIDEWLVSGAMGVVFRGYDPILDRPVAIKILRRELAKGSAAEGWRDRFRRRARAGGRLFHPNIATTLDFAEDHEIPFIAMEYVDGSRLDRLQKISGRFGPQRAAAMILQVLDALKYSHEMGVVHLDLKPSVLLVLANDRIKVTNFGTALADASDLASAEISGSVPCMAPEQLAGGPVDYRTDLFAAGALLFEMLTCVKPFSGASVDEIVAQMATQRSEDVCALNPEVPWTLRSIIDTALAYDPRQRFATASEFSSALSAAVSLGAETAMHPAPPAWPPAREEGWDSEILRKVEADLATHIGPVAPIAVRRAAQRANDLVALYEELAVHIDNDRERGEFLRSGAGFAAAASDWITFSQPENLQNDPIPQGNSPAHPPDAIALDAIETQLAQYVGPIARVLLKQQLQNFHSMPELYRSLANHISDDAERAAFLNSGRV
jgi:eukaryotic-like serine/threonine-protein kinase